MAATLISLPQFNGLKPQAAFSASPLQGLVSVQPRRNKGQGALGARCDFIGSSTNLIWVSTIGKREGNSGWLKLEVRDCGLRTGDPAGFTLADTLACGTVGHIIGVGVVLGLKNIGAI
ncbi:unnamed protein product [Withania somnifera]